MVMGMENTKERRFFVSPVQFEVRDGQPDENIIEGYAAVFNKPSEDFGGWTERIAPGAFDDVVNDDAVALFNHDMNQVLGRNGVNVKISQDDTGLKYRIKLPDTTVAKDLRQLIKDGIISQSSFGFTVRSQEWKHEKDKPSVRTITKVRRLYDVSPVTYPAYPDTTVATRSFQDEVKKDNKVANVLPLEYRERKLKISKAK